MFYFPAFPIKVSQKKLTVFSEKLGIMNYSKVYLFIRLFDFICLHLMDISRYDNTYFPRILCLICYYSRQRTLSRYYIQRGGKNMNYAKKVVIFLHANFLNEENKIKMNERITSIHF